MRDVGATQFAEDLLEHGYKELTFPATPDGSYAMNKDALHIWPRGSHMLMGLADPNGTFTGTIYLAKTGPESFASLDTEDKVIDFMRKYYPDAIPLLGGEKAMAASFLSNHMGILGTVRTDNWHIGGNVLLLGDAAHAIVPFFGQGCNCGFEDCLYFDKFLREHGDDFAKVGMKARPIGGAPHCA
jgi:kynurenine 3-monooxygenase